MIKIITIKTMYMGDSLYHPGLVYEPTEQVMFMPTLWASEHPNTGTAQTYLKIIQAFCRYYDGQIKDRGKAAEVIPKFERFIHENDIKAWMTERWQRRLQEESESPKDRTIEKEAYILGIYIDWAKEQLLKQGIQTPFKKAKKKIKIVSLKRDKNFLAGVVNKIQVKHNQHNLHLSYPPSPNVRPKVISRSTQRNGHAYFKPLELEEFILSFSDPLWTAVGLTGYCTGLRPHETLAIPSYAPYSNGKFFTSDPSMLRQLKADGQKEIVYECLGKSKKDREVIFLVDDWLNIMMLYEPIFQQRRMFFEEHAGRELEPHELWLSKPNKKPGKMVQYCLPGDNLNYDQYLQPLRSAVAYAKKKHNLVGKFGHAVDFYSLRHTYATNFIKIELQRNKDLRERAGRNPDMLLHDYSLRKRLQDQLGHEEFDTTFRHYIDNVVAAQAMSFPDMAHLLDSARQKSVVENPPKDLT